MNLKKIKEELLRAAELVEDFEKNGRTIDRDAAINKIRNVYEELRFMAPPVVVDEPSAEPLVPFEPEQEDEPEVEVEFIMPEQDEAEDEVESAVEEPEEVPTEAEPEEPEESEEVVYVAEEDEPEAEEPAAEVEPEVDEESDSVEVVEDIDPDSAFEPEEDEEPTPEPAPESEPTPEPISEPTPEPEPKKVVVEPSLFGDYEPISRKSTHTRRKIMALYEEEPAVVAPKPEPKPEPKVEVEPTPAPTPAPAPTPKVEPAVDTENKVLGEVITPKTTIADTITPVVSVAEDRPVATLRGAISVVDRFMLMRDLFDDDAQLYEQTIDALEAMDNLDDCIIYIAENFAWRPSSEGAKLMMDLLQRKLG